MRRVIGLALLVAWGIASYLIAKTFSTGTDMNGAMPIQVATVLVFLLAPAGIAVLALFARILWDITDWIGEWVLDRRR